MLNIVPAPLAVQTDRIFFWHFFWIDIFEGLAAAKHLNSRHFLKVPYCLWKQTLLCPPVAFKEVGLGHVLPPHGRLDALSRHAVAELGDVLGVSRLQHCVLKHPELLACTSRKTGRNKLEGQATAGITLQERHARRADLHRQIQALQQMAGNNLLPSITVFDVDVSLI